MPPGLDKMLGEQKMRDLMAYLLTSLQPADLVFPFLPPIRKNLEAEEVLRRSKPSSDGVKTDEPFRILWVSGPKDHGPDEHDYPLQQKRWARSEEHTSELQSLMRISYAVFCLKKKIKHKQLNT